TAPADPSRRSAGVGRTRQGSGRNSARATSVGGVYPQPPRRASNSPVTRTGPTARPRQSLEFWMHSGRRLVEGGRPMRGIDRAAYLRRTQFTVSQPAVAQGFLFSVLSAAW